MRILFDEHEIAAAVAAMAKAIAARSPRIELAVPVLTGAFVFAADLVRALSKEGVDPAVECISLSRYGASREGIDAIAVRLGAGDGVHGRHVLLIDGVLDHGHTLAFARTMLREAGAASVTTAVAVDKLRPDGLLKADFVAFPGAGGFIVGYGMDDNAHGRGLPHIARVD